MKKLFQSIGLVLTLGTGVLGQAHEDHDHGVPGDVSPQKGGEIKAAFGTYFELLKEGEQTKIFVFKPTKDAKGKTVLEPLSLSKVKINNSTATPKPSGKAEKITLSPQEDHFITSYAPPKGKNRYVLRVDFEIETKKDFVEFSVEKN